MEVRYEVDFFWFHFRRAHARPSGKDIELLDGVHFIDLIYPVGKHAKEGLNPFTHTHTHTHIHTLTHTPRFYSVY